MNSKNFYGIRTLENSNSESLIFSSFEDSEDEYQIVSDALISSNDSKTYGEFSDNKNNAAPSAKAGLQASAGTSVRNNQPVGPQTAVWVSDFTARARFPFTNTKAGLHKRIILDDGSPIMPIEIFYRFFEDEIIEMIAFEINRCAH